MHIAQQRHRGLDDANAHSMSPWRIALILVTPLIIACNGAEGPMGPIGQTGATGQSGATGPVGPAGASGASPIFISATGTNSLIADNSVLGFTPVPGLSATISIPSASTYKLLIETDGGVQLNSSDPNASGFTDIAVFINGAQVGSGRRIPVLNSASVLNSVGSYGFSVQTILPGGTYVITVMAKKFSSIFTDCYVSSAASGSVLPGNPRLQGILNVIAFP